jgi:hypothetical protein
VFQSLTEEAGGDECIICKSGKKKFLSTSERRAALAEKNQRNQSKQKAPRKPKKKKKNILFQLPSWGFSITLCDAHSKESEFLSSLETRPLAVHFNPACEGKTCHCANGLTTCDGRMNPQTVVARWVMLQESARGNVRLSRAVHIYKAGVKDIKRKQQRSGKKARRTNT